MSHQAKDLAASREQAKHTSMFVRMLVRAAVLRRGRAASALFAMIVAAAVATAMLNLYVDVQAKLQREFRNYGANVILVGKNSASLPADALAHVDATLSGRGIEDALHQELHRPARLLAAIEPRRENAGVVKDNQIAGPQQVGKIPKQPVSILAAGSLQMQHPGVVTAGKWFLGDEFVGQVEVEVRNQHAVRL